MGEGVPQVRSPRPERQGAAWAPRVRAGMCACRGPLQGPRCEAELAAGAACRKPRGLASAQVSRAEEIGLEGTGVGRQPGDGSIWQSPSPPGQLGCRHLSRPRTWAILGTS